jgi:hypothetical protein
VVGAAALIALLAGCGQIDQIYDLSMVNDTGQPVSIGLCADDDCSGTDWREGVAPGASQPANAASDTPTWFIAYLPDGGRRCLMVNLAAEPARSFAVSSFGAC